MTTTQRNKWKSEIKYMSVFFGIPSLILAKKVQTFHLASSEKISKGKTKRNVNATIIEETQTIIQHWIRILNIKLGWIQDFDKLVVKYVKFLFIQWQIFIATNFFMLDAFCSSSKLLKTFTGHKNDVMSIDHLTFDYGQFICSGSKDRTVCVWDIDNNKQIRSFDGHAGDVYCVKFSQYHYHNNRRTIICSSSFDKTIRFWDTKYNQQFQVLNEHTGWIGGIEFSSFNGGRYLCSGSYDKTIRLWDVETFKSLNIFNGHTRT
ncbi:WD repeat-containing protein, partial [Reticulomyxa filosa]